MIAGLMMMLSSTVDPTASAMIAKASGLTAVSDCANAGCAALPPTRFRVTRTANTDPTSKDRAFADDGTYCGVLGDKRCTSNGRPILTAPITYD